ncbi:DoxX family protein [Agromyces italicus]|uniref:DoxX family protein n=1 Tax=Agromyces italicus TaxID=279572 RepID=UPI0003B42D01|nr:DoxX family protein [Agromyces italicus]
MIIALWIVTAMLALAFVMAGTMKAVTPYERVGEKMPWVEDVNPAQLKGIGVLEAIGAIGLILPAATGIAPWLTPVAAFGLAGMMAVAVGLHIRRREPFAPSLVLGIIALAVGIGWLIFA